MLSRLYRRAKKTLNRLRLPPVAYEVQRRHLTYLSEAKFLSLRDAIRQIKHEGVLGDFIEYGIALGGSAVYLASELDGRRRSHGYDVFGMIPAPGEHDDEDSKARYEVIRSGRSKGIGDDVYYGIRATYLAEYARLSSRLGAPSTARGWFCTPGYSKIPCSSGRAMRSLWRISTATGTSR